MPVLRLDFCAPPQYRCTFPAAFQASVSSTHMSGSERLGTPFEASERDVRQRKMHRAPRISCVVAPFATRKLSNGIRPGPSHGPQAHLGEFARHTVALSYVLDIGGIVEAGVALKRNTLSRAALWVRPSSASLRGEGGSLFMT